MGCLLGNSSLQQVSLGQHCTVLLLRAARAPVCEALLYVVALLGRKGRGQVLLGYE
jgi:hypothetical protein